MNPLLELSEVTFRHGASTVLDGISFVAGPGEFIALLGANGAGKSTLLDLLSGSRQPAAGRIRIAGRDLPTWPAPDLAREISHLPQSVAPDLPFTAGELVAQGRYPHLAGWFESPDDQRAIAEAMNRTGCLAWRDRQVATLSGGERQRVLLAAVLAQQARILLLDEPSTFLDIDQQLACFALLREEADHGRLCLAVTHDLNMALRFCTRLVILAGGSIVRDLATSLAATDPDWLPLFSPRLQLHPAHQPGAAPWVGYR